MLSKTDYQRHILTFGWPLMSATYCMFECVLFTVFPVYCAVKWFPGFPVVEPMSKSTSVINSDFVPCPFLYVVVVITIIQRRQALSVKAWCSFPSICLRHFRAFPAISFPAFLFILCLKMPVGLNCSNALSYELPALSLIYWICCPIYFLSKINSKKSAGFHHPKGNSEI